MKGMFQFSIVAVSLSLISCNSLFYDISSPSSEYIKPEVAYVYPEPGLVDVPTNTSILVSFNKEIDIASIDSEALHVVDEFGNVLRGEIAFHEKSIAIFEPEEPMIPHTAYSAIVKKDVRDMEGGALDDDYSWSFMTGSEEDLISPEIVSTLPEHNAACPAESVSITATFNEDINPLSITPETFRVENGEDIVAGATTYDAGRRSIIFVPYGRLNDNSRYRVAVMNIRDLAKNPLSAEFVWNFRTGAIRIELEDARNCENGFATFGHPPRRLFKDDGFPLSEGTDFTYDVSIASLFDSGINGAFEPGKYFRIVENGKNIVDSNGLALVPVARMILFSDINRIAPKPYQCYIDPMSGYFILPRPDYWSRLESLDDIGNAEIYGTTPSYSGSQLFCTAGKFGNCIYQYASTENLNGNRFFMYPFGVDENTSPHGTASFWVRYQPPSSGRYYIKNHFLFGNINFYFLSLTSSVNKSILYINNVLFASANINWKNWIHVYMVWANDRSLSGGKTIRIFINGQEYFSTAELIDTSGVIYFLGIMSIVLSDQYGYNYWDNIKIWKHVVSEDPSWEYNSGAGREDALHEIYGPDNGYRPLLTGPGNGVGYYYVP